MSWHPDGIEGLRLQDAQRQISRGTSGAVEHARLRLTAAALVTMDDCACSTSTAAAQALALSGTVLVTGPDPKLAKATPRAFHHTLDGQTTLSSSGLPQVSI